MFLSPSLGVCIAAADSLLQLDHALFEAVCFLFVAAEILSFLPQSALSGPVAVDLSAEPEQQLDHGLPEAVHFPLVAALCLALAAEQLDHAHVAV